MGERWRSGRRGAGWGPAMSLVLVALAPALPACEPGPSAGTWAWSLEPAALDFGEQAVGVPVAQTVTVSHDSDVPVQATLRIEGPYAGAFAVQPSQAAWPAGAAVPLTVTFHAEGPGQAWGTLVVAPERGDPIELPVRGLAWPPGDFVDRTALDFGTVTQGGLRTLGFQAHNPTAVPREIRVAPPEGPGAAAFVPLEPRAVTLPPGGHAAFQVTYAPPGLGAHAAELPVFWSPTAPPLRMPLEGAATGVLEVSPDQLLLANVEPGRTLEGDIAFEWDGEAALRVEASIESPEGDEAAWRVTPEALLLEPGVASRLTIAFSPLSQRLHTATLVWRTDDPAHPGGRIHLSGYAGGPWIQAPATADLGVTAPGQPLVGAVQVENVGSRALTLQGASLFGSGGFRLVGAVAGLEIPRWSSASIPVVFEPLAPGDYGGVLRVDSDDPLTPRVEVPLQARAVAVGDCELRLPQGLDFGYVATGETRRRVVTVEVPESAADPCWIFGADTDGTPFRAELPQGVEVAQGTRLDVPVELTPATAGPASGHLRLRVGDSEAPLRTVPLTGWSGDPWIRVSPDALGFHDVVPGETAAAWVLVERVEPGFDLLDVYLYPEGPGFDAVIEARPGPTDAAMLVEVRFTPQGEGLHRGLLVLREGPGADARAHVVTLYGTTAPAP